MGDVAAVVQASVVDPLEPAYIISQNVRKINGANERGGAES
jgi:hypothetical protein